MPGLLIRKGKLLEYNFQWKCSQFRNKLGLSIQMKVSNNAKHRNAVCLKVGDRLKFEDKSLEAKASICSTIKENLILHCCKFPTIVVAITN